MKANLFIYIGFLTLSCSSVEKKIFVEDIDNKTDIYVTPNKLRDSIEVHIPLTYRIINNSGEPISLDFEFTQSFAKHGDKPVLVSFNNILYRGFDDKMTHLPPYTTSKELTYYFRKLVAKKSLKDFDSTQVPVSRDSVKMAYNKILGNSNDALLLRKSIENDSIAFTFRCNGHIMLKIKRVGDKKFYTLTEKDLFEGSKTSSYFNPAQLKKANK